MEADYFVLCKSDPTRGQSGVPLVGLKTPLYLIDPTVSQLVPSYKEKFLNSDNKTVVSTSHSDE